MACSRTLRYGDGPDQYVEVWDPANDACGSAVLIHGGYWRDRYSLDLMDPMAEHLSNRGWRVWNIEYRRIRPSDESGRWDEMSADVRAAIALAGAHPDPVVVIGHSAGGQLALWAAADANQLPDPRSLTEATSARGRVDAVVALAPVADLHEAERRNLSDGAARLLLGGGAADVPDRYRQASPTKRLPLGVPQLVVHGEADDAVPIDFATDYTSLAKAEGDNVTLLNPADVDHFHIIDPTHPVWEPIQAKLDEWRAELATAPSTATTAATPPGDRFAQIADEVGRFTGERGWDPYHNPKNLLLALVGEVGELSELFQWLSPHEAANPPPELLADIEDEAADVLIYLIQLARKLDIDLLLAVQNKMEKNAKKYPAPEDRA